MPNNTKKTTTSTPKNAMPSAMKAGSCNDPKCASKKATPSAIMKSAPDSACKCESASEICCLTDQDIIADVLGSTKALVTLYSTALCESSCKNMRNLVDTQLSECATDQFDMFLYMNERGLYPTEAAPTQKVMQAKNKFCQAKQDMTK